MKVSRWAAAVMFLFLFVVVAQDVFAQRGRSRAEEDVEAGGWYMGYGDELTERDAEQGNVAPGVSLYNSDREEVRAWAESLVRQAMALMVNRRGTDTVRDFGHDEQREARRLTIQTVREMLGSRQSGSAVLDLRSIEVKAGVLEYRSRRSGGGYEERRGRETIFVPYVGLRPTHERRHRDRHDREYRGQ